MLSLYCKFHLSLQLMLRTFFALVNMCRITIEILADGRVGLCVE